MPQLDRPSPAGRGNVLAAAGRKLTEWWSKEPETSVTLPGLYGKLSLFTFVVFCLNVLVLLYFYVITGYGQLDEGGENAPVEPLTAALFAVSGIVLFLAAVAAGHRWLRWVYILGGLALLFAAGEEASWGQHIFGFATPEFLWGTNYQGETNFHNTYLLGGIFGALSYATPTPLYVATVVAFILRKYSLGPLPLPSLWLAFFFALGIEFNRGLSLLEIITLEGRHLLLILGIFLGVALLARDKKLLTAVVAVIALSGAAYYLHDRFPLYSQVAYLEISEYLISLAAFLYSLQLLRDSGRARWPVYGQRVKVLAGRIWTRTAAENSRPPRRGWEYHSWHWAWPAACLLVVFASIGLILFDRQLTASWSREYQALLTNPPTFQSPFWNIYHTPGRLTYVKNAACPRIRDKEPRFFLHVIPVHEADLPAEARETGFQNLNFDYNSAIERFLSPDGRCMAVIELPDYPMAQIETGQHDFWETRLWTAYLDLDEPYYRAAYQPIAAGQAGPPLTRAEFDLYRYNNALYYFKESCAAADTAARFFLHIYPIRVADLPPERQPYRFSNLDFDFNRRGQEFDGKCMAVVALPDYPIAEIRTGQFTAGGTVWETVLPAGN